MNTHKARAFRPWRYAPQLARFDQLPITKVALEPTNVPHSQERSAP